MNGILGWSLLWLLALSPPAWPGKSEAGLKGAYVLNFSKYAHWPAQVERGMEDELHLCIAGLSSVAKILQDSEGESVGGRRLKTDLVKLPGNLSDCHLLYISGWDLERKRHLLENLGRLPILTVSDVEGFARAGGMIELVVVERRLRFEIDLHAVKRAGLRLDPQLLELAVHLYRSRPGRD